jgi:hypothetical protein
MRAIFRPAAMVPPRGAQPAVDTAKVRRNGGSVRSSVHVITWLVGLPSTPCRERAAELCARAIRVLETGVRVDVRRCFQWSRAD